MIKVRIDKAEKETFWYSNKIGQEFNVENWRGCKEWYRCTFDAKGIFKSDCTVLQSDTQHEPSSKAILDNSPKLIAKAGEWVKPTYFDKCFIMTNNNGWGLVLNDPVLLHQDLYSDSTKIYIESRYGIQHNEPDLGKTRFELCPAPVSEPVQVDTPIERDTEDFKIGQIIEVHKEPYYRKMKVESGWMYNFYDTKNDNYSRGWIFVPEHSLKN